MGRNVLTAQSFTEPLGFLYAHGADYLLIVNDEIGKYPAYSTIGSDENYDRRSFIPTYILDQANTQETRNGSLLVYTGGGFPLEKNFAYEDKILPAGSTLIGGFIIPIINDGEKIIFVEPRAALFYQPFLIEARSSALQSVCSVFFCTDDFFFCNFFLVQMFE